MSDKNWGLGGTAAEVYKRYLVPEHSADGVPRPVRCQFLTRSTVLK
jgi:hypothetical protein